MGRLTRVQADAWWRAPISSILLVVAGLTVIGFMVAQGEHASAVGYSAGLALVGLGITGRIQAWAGNGKPPRKENGGDVGS